MRWGSGRPPVCSGSCAAVEAWRQQTPQIHRPGFAVARDDTSLQWCCRYQHFEGRHLFLLCNSSHPAAIPADESTVSLRDTRESEKMIRQAINCDMCGAERVEPTSHWFVVDEVAGELRLRGWESPKGARKNVKHLCGQKCVQRLMDNFTASMVASVQAKQAKEAAAEKKESAVLPVQDREEMPILERMGYDRETVAMIEADSWAGPARPKESWGASDKARSEREGFLNATHGKTSPVRPFQRTA